MTKIFECRICKDLAKKQLKGFERVRGTRYDIRKHLREEHNLKGTVIIPGSKKEISQISNNTLKEDWN